MTQLVILVGLQGAGKSTFYRRRLAATHTLVSKDLILRGDKNVGQRRQITEAFLRGESVVADNTNATLASRAELITLARAHAARVIGYAFPPELAENLRRNAERTGKARVPDGAIIGTLKRLVAPTRAEGFDELYHVRIVEDDYAIVAS